MERSPVCDEIKIARLEVKQEEHMRQFERHCAEESDNFDALFNQTRKLESSLEKVNSVLSSQRGFIGGVVFCVGGLFAIIVASLNYFIKP
jgi:hypothetical protein